MAISPPVCDFGAPMPSFDLRDLDGRRYTPTAIRGVRGTLVMFLCNHCPYVQAIMDRLVRDAAELQQHGIGVVAIASNDVATYPEDGPDGMAAQARQHGFTFPYLFDETQEVAKAFGAACTPDFLGYNTDGALQYRGRLDASGRTPGPPDARRELFEAMMQIAATGQGPRDQISSLGCSIKWAAQ